MVSKLLKLNECYRKHGAPNFPLLPQWPLAIFSTPYLKCQLAAFHYVDSSYKS